MIRVIEVGDRVRMRAAYAEHHRTNYSAAVDWLKREGTAVRIGRYNQMVTVRWDGRRSLDQWPGRALERVPELVGGES